jgi:hypothetical protein
MRNNGGMRYYRDDDDTGHEYETEVRCLGKTPGGALKLKRLDDDRVFFVPYSVVHDDSEVFKQGDVGKLVIQTWWAEQNGLE